MDAWADCPSLDPNADYNCPLGPIYVLPSWTNAAGWTQPSQYQTIKLGDLDGDGKDELIARDPSGLYVDSFNTTRGLWEPVVRTDGKGLLILPLSDAAGWGPAQYSTTIQLADVDGQPGKELVVRGPNGLLVFKFIEGTLSNSPFKAGSWQQLNTSGPFADTHTFKNGKNWGSDVAYYSTIRLADIDGEPGVEAIGWGGDGLAVAKWNGTGWSALTGIPTFEDAIVAAEPSYLPLQLADLDGQPGAELISRQNTGGLTGGGLLVSKYQPGPSGGTWSNVVSGGPFANDPSDCPDRSCYATIRTADLDGDHIAEVVGRQSDGNVVVYQLTMTSPTSGQWTFVGSSTLFAASEWSQPGQYETIQLAEVDGQPGAELLAKDVGGIVVYKWDPTAKTFTPLASNIPALSADPWSTDRSYWATIQTGDVDGDKKAELLARGPYGMRTWRYQPDQRTWSRYVPAGGFPPFTGTEAAAYTALNTFLGIQAGTIRDAYTDPTRTTTANELKNFQDSIVGRCAVETSATPPQYRRCGPPPGSGIGVADWTAVSNQIIAELFWAQHVIDHFTTLGDLTTNLFLDENSTFPSLAADLKLDSEGVTDQTKATVNYTTLVFNEIANVLKFAGSFAGPEGAPLVVAGNALAVVMGVEPTLFPPSNPSSGGATFDHAFADVQRQITIIQQQTQDLLSAQRHQVLSDANLLTTVGTLVNSQLWALDTAGALSVSRQQFALWALQAFLPEVWDRWVITGCTADTRPFTTDCVGVTVCCGGGTWLRTNDEGVSFTAVLPKQEPCSIQGENKVCEWDQAPSTTMTNLLFNSISDTCTYQPGTTNAWVYGLCSLGLGIEGWDVNGILDNKNGWNFLTRAGNPVPGPEGSVNGAEASAVGTPRQGRLKLSAEIPLLDPLDLRTAVLTLEALLQEVNGAGELVNDQTGTDLSPLVLLPPPGARETEAEFTTPRGRLPQVKVRLKVEGEVLKVRLQVDRASIESPGKCAGSNPATRLHLKLRVDDGVDTPVELVSREHWACERNHGGRVTGLHFP